MLLNKEYVKKIIFPFFNKNQHAFLLRKWWFRTIIVVYIIIFLIMPFIIFAMHVDSSSGWCYDSLSSYYEDKKEFNDHLKVCGELLSESRIPGVGLGIIGTFVPHYLIQIIFFKIIIDFIFLGSKK